MSPKAPTPSLFALHNDVGRYDLAIHVLDQYHASQVKHYAEARAALLDKREKCVMAIAEAQAKQGASEDGRAKG